MCRPPNRRELGINHLGRRKDSAPRVALVMGHPGHELAVFGWTSRLRPRVHIMTDGGGRSARARLFRTDALLHALGAERSDALNPVPDADLYDLMLRGDVSAFTDRVDTLVDSFLSDGIELVMTDSAEGFNPTHDVCHAIALAAARIAARRAQHPIACFEYDLAAPLLAGIVEGNPGPDIVLSERLFRAKVDSAMAYSELDSDIRELIRVCGLDSFRREALRPTQWNGTRYSARPHYELVGEQRVRDGVYSEALRHAHVKPILDALQFYPGARMAREAASGEPVSAGLR